MTLAGPGRPPATATELLSREPGVAWAGWLEQEAKEELLRSSQVFVMPSRSEGLPMALLEAMAYGLAVLATEVGGIPEIVEPGVDGLLVAAEEPGAFADALARLGGDPALRERLGEGARRRVERLDAVEVAGRLGSIYAALV